MKDKMQMAIAYRLPKWLVKWAAIRLIAHATTGKYGNTVVSDLNVMEALNRWGRLGREPRTSDEGPWG